MRLNNESNIKVRSGGVGFGGLLALLFIGLKLGGVIGWSWWWVLSPLWIPLALVLAVVALAFAGVLAAHGLVALHEYRQARKGKG